MWLYLVEGGGGGRQRGQRRFGPRQHVVRRRRCAAPFTAPVDTGAVVILAVLPCGVVFGVWGEPLFQLIGPPLPRGWSVVVGER